MLYCLLQPCCKQLVLNLGLSNHRENVLVCFSKTYDKTVKHCCFLIIYYCTWWYFSISVILVVLFSLPMVTKYY